MLSYSALTNYGKVTLPSVESWYTNNNIVRDPPRSVMTRKIDRVGDTAQILATLAESDDRFCEAINHYARGVNPMVSVSYGEAQTKDNTSDRGNAFLPYRVIRDGAFRPPIRRQEDLLPLSRLPRNWTTVDPRPFEADFTKRVFDCGTDKTTREVRDELLGVACETRRTIAAEPSLTAPQPRYMIKDPLAPGTTTNACDTRREVMFERPTVLLRESAPLVESVFTNLRVNEERRPFEPDAELRLDRNVPSCSAATNPTSRMNDRPMVADHVRRLIRNVPTATAWTNLAATGKWGNDLTDAEYTRLLPGTASRGTYDGRPSIPMIA